MGKCGEGLFLSVQFAASLFKKTAEQIFFLEKEILLGGCFASYRSNTCSCLDVDVTCHILLGVFALLRLSVLLASFCR